MQDYLLSLSFPSSNVSTLDVRKFARLETYFTAEEVNVHLVDESQVTDAFNALREVGVQPADFFLAAKDVPLDDIEPEWLVGAIVHPEYTADVANSDLDCRMFVPDGMLLELCSAPAKKRPLVSARNRYVMDAELADYFASAADVIPEDVSIAGKVSDQWRSVHFTRKHSILHGLPHPESYSCRFCNVRSGASPSTSLGRCGDWDAPLYCDAQPTGHGFGEYRWFVPIDHLAEFDQWTKYQVHFQPVFSDSAGPGRIAYRVLSGALGECGPSECAP